MVEKKVMGYFIIKMVNIMMENGKMIRKMEREKFWFNELSAAKKKGAIGFEIINNKPQCKDCAELAGKKFYFEQKLTTKLPPLHPGCRCILKAIYADNFDFGVQ